MLHAVGDVDDNNDGGDGSGDCADDDSVIWVFSLIYLFVFDQCPQEKASLIIGIFWFFSPLSSLIG